MLRVALSTMPYNILVSLIEPGLSSSAKAASAVSKTLRSHLCSLRRDGTMRRFLDMTPSATSLSENLETPRTAIPVV